MIHPERIHFIGIGGVGMSALAKFAVKAGSHVSGSDLRENGYIEELRKMGVRVRLAQDGECGPVDRVVVSSAIPEDNPELTALRKRGVEVVHRSGLLADYINHFCGLAVAGTHGKTTTTALLFHLLREAGTMPSGLTGGELISEKTNCVVGSSDLLVAEADESDGSFVSLKPRTSVITSIDPDVNVTAEAYRDCGYSADKALRRVETLFQTFAENTLGAVVACLDHPGVRRNIPKWNAKVLTYGLSAGADLRATDVSRRDFLVSANLTFRGESVGRIRVPLPGNHNLLNAMAAVLCAHEHGVRLTDAIRFVSTFKGVRRRFEVVARTAGRVFVDDYAHNPQKIEAALRGARDGDAQRIIAVFQPHRYTRTKLLQGSFPPCFAGADLVLVTDIYSAGEEPLDGVHGARLAQEIGSAAPTLYTPDYEAVKKAVQEHAREGDLIIGLGAGSVGEWIKRLSGECEPEIPAMLSAAA